MAINVRRPAPSRLQNILSPRCANRCGRDKHKGDIYCIPCRDQVTVEAWLVLKPERFPQ